MSARTSVQRGGRHFVTARADGQRRLYELRLEPFIDLAAWLEPYRAIWERRLDLLGNRLDAMKREEEAEP